VFVIAGLLHTVEGFIDFGFSENLMDLRLKGQQPVCMRFSKGTVYQLLFNQLTHRLRSAEDSPADIDFLYLDLVRSIQKIQGADGASANAKN
jgi:hypothetical protein